MELTWLQFRNQSHIKMLSESQQKSEYYFYLDGLSNQIYQQSKGPKQLRLQVTGFLLQEDLFLIEQENGSGIYITAYA